MRGFQSRSYPRGSVPNEERPLRKNVTTERKRTTVQKHIYFIVFLSKFVMFYILAMQAMLFCWSFDIFYYYVLFIAMLMLEA